MPVTRVSAGQQGKFLAGNLTSHDMSITVNVPATAGAYTYGIAAYGWQGSVSVAGDPISCEWAGEAVLPLLPSPLLFASNESVLMGWIIESPTSGVVEMEHTGIGTSLTTKSRYFTAGVWSQAEPLDLGNIQAAVVSAIGSGAVTQSGVTVPSILPASRVIGAHLVRGKKITDYNGARAAIATTSSQGGLLLGERRGAATVASTVSHASTSAWAAFGLNLDPAPVVFGAKGTHRAGKGSFGGSVYRYAEPHPDRFYRVPKVGSAEVSLVGGNFVRSADGVLMPVWAKDPDDAKEYTLDWSEHLADDDKIIHVEHTVSGSLRRFSEAIDDSGALTQVWLTGGTVNVTRSVRVRWSTARGRREDRTFWIVGTSN